MTLPVVYLFTAEIKKRGKNIFVEKQIRKKKLLKKSFFFTKGIGKYFAPVFTKESKIFDQNQTSFQTNIFCAFS